MTRSAIAYLRPPQDGAPAEQAVPQRRHDLEVVATVGEPGPTGRERLGDALEQIAAGRASVLLVGRLDAVGGSLGELVALLDWLAAAGADLVALDVDLDTGSSAGRRTVAALGEVERWAHRPEPGRPPRGRPGLATRAPELGERIAGMRERGLSLRAIADALNEEGVPTQRGGSHWRASSVQAALGYRRPRPPLPGLPPPPPHAAPHRPAHGGGPAHPPGTHPPGGAHPRPRGGPRP